MRKKEDSQASNQYRNLDEINWYTLDFTLFTWYTLDFTWSNVDQDRSRCIPRGDHEDIHACLFLSLVLYSRPK